MKKALFLILAVVVLLACGVSNEQLTATAVVQQEQSQTAVPTRTVTRTPTATATLRPTATPRPTQTPEPTPAAVGETIQFNGLEITVLKALQHAQIIVYSYKYYDANEGYTFADLMIRVRNRGNTPSWTEMGQIYVIDEESTAWMPFYGDFEIVELEKSFDPATIINWHPIGEKEAVPFGSKKDTYLRLIWVIPEHQDLIFGIQNSPRFAIPMP